MLIRLILSPADEHRSGANQMRQHLSFREHFRRGNARSNPDCRAIVSILANWLGDKLMTAEAVRGGNRRYLVALSLLLTAAGLAIPFVQSLAAIIVLVTIAVSFAHVGPATIGALVSDLLRSPGDAGRAFAFLVLGGNTFGLLAPILTGYIVAATGSFDSAFIVAGALAFVGEVAALVLARGTLGEHVRPHLARPGLACAAIAGPV
jgi:MFS family permease